MPLATPRLASKLSELDPWDREYWAAKEEETLAEMRYCYAPSSIVNLQVKQVVYLGENQWEVKEDAGPDFATFQVNSRAAESSTSRNSGHTEFF